jgi:hypothetical protein
MDDQSALCIAMETQIEEQPHLARHLELLRSCSGKVAAWINEVGDKGVQMRTLQDEPLHSPRVAPAVLPLNSSLVLVQNTRIDYKWQ